MGGFCILEQKIEKKNGNLASDTTRTAIALVVYMLSSIRIAYIAVIPNIAHLHTGKQKSYLAVIKQTKDFFLC